MNISIKNTLAFLAFFGTLAIALPAFGQEIGVVTLISTVPEATTTDVMALDTVATVTTPAAVCPDFGYAKIGDENNTVQVSNLQTFLKNSESLDVDVSGTFDVKTEQAVEAFQRKYMTDIMGPWDATRPSGVVNLTTVKKIKQLLCGEPLSLNARELMAIADYQNGSSSWTASADGSVDTSSLVLEPVGVSGQSQSAAVGTSGGASLMHRFLSFVKHIFVR